MNWKMMKFETMAGVLQTTALTLSVCILYSMSAPAARALADTPLPSLNSLSSAVSQEAGCENATRKNVVGNICCHRPEPEILLRFSPGTGISSSGFFAMCLLWCKICKFSALSIAGLFAS